MMMVDENAFDIIICVPKSETSEMLEKLAYVTQNCRILDIKFTQNWIYSDTFGCIYEQ